MTHPLSRPRVEAIVATVLHTERLSLQERTLLRAEARKQLMALTRAKDVDAVEKALSYGYLQALSYDGGTFIQGRYYDQACTTINRHLFHLSNNVRAETTDTEHSLVAFRNQLDTQREYRALTVEEARLTVVKERKLRGADAQTEKVRKMYDAAEKRIPFLQHQLENGFDHRANGGSAMLRANAVATNGEGPEASLATLMLDLSIKGDAENAIADSLAAELDSMTI